LFAAAQADTSGRWGAWTFTSHDNPYLSRLALAEITQDMSALAYRQEILAEDIDEVPGALWTRGLLEGTRVLKAPPLQRIVVGVDPGHNAGVVVAGIGEDGDGYILDDLSCSGSPTDWATAAVVGYHKYHANRIVPERNHGGEMVETTIRMVDSTAAVRTVWASQGKFARAEPVSTLYEKGRVHHVGAFPALEDELCIWVPGTGQPSPNRLDACVWALTDLMLTGQALPDLDLGGAFADVRVSPWALS
jgi:phage terminase large subunit-like protein